ncbi:molybdenum cofactor biosynthesis protein MoaC [Veillonella montpellierensis DNF00314]|uniref:Cyclic pyranopterin monophosphate synthase n=1 Tax=Veillonella montpellierensis DNF00314 TaxID=1401067 RepID=A0A096AJV4_9FIRM|nr:cyclic pyranopterin monophosphate synthase MoaC [Veillonella montpellierensis]KGF47358.1 molybdenum cofactor biosynthesis protein MoaC [Veillonella montpellierensis DNF00314]
MELTHFDKDGNARMVDVGHKAITDRMAVAEGFITVNETIYKRIEEGTMKKGDVLSVAQLAAIMGAKQTSQLIPLCHPLALTKVDVHCQLVPDTWQIKITAMVKTRGQTGVEMEALTAVHVGLLTIYDMCKAVDKGMVIGPIYLVEKDGGKSGHFIRREAVDRNIHR